MDAPTDDGGNVVTAYEVWRNDTYLGQFPATSNSIVVPCSDLDATTPVSFTVASVNAIGTSDISAPSTPITIPAAPPKAPHVNYVVPEDSQVRLSWEPPADTGGAPITSYTVAASPDGQTVSTGSTDALVSGLTNGISYTFTVTATNEAGTSEPSAPSQTAIPARVPASPPVVTASPGDASAKVRWSAPASDGAPISSYLVRAWPGGKLTNVSAGATSTTVRCLTNGRKYTFTVAAANTMGTGAWQTSKVGVPRSGGVWG